MSRIHVRTYRHRRGKRKCSIKRRRRKTRRRRRRRFEYASVELKPEPERNWRAGVSPAADGGGLTADKLITLQPSHYVAPD